MSLLTTEKSSTSLGIMIIQEEREKNEDLSFKIYKAFKKPLQRLIQFHAELEKIVKTNSLKEKKIRGDKN